MGDWTGQIHQGDAAEVLGQMPESSVHMAMCSPPYYGLRDYGVDGQIGLEDSLDEYIQDLLDVADELQRVLRPDGSWWLNLGDTFGGDSIVRGDGEWTRPGEDGYEEAHTASYGDGRRSMSPLGRKNKLLVPHRVAIALQEAGWVLRADAVWYKPNPMPDPVADRFNEVKEYVFHLTAKPDYWFDLDAIREKHAEASIQRAGRHDHTERDYPGAEPQTLDPEQFVHPDGKNPGDVLEITVKPFPDAHFAVYPPELCEAPIKASCPPEVCVECGTPYDRESEVVEREVAGGSPAVPSDGTGYKDRTGNHQGDYGDRDGFTQPTRRRIGEWEPVCDCDTDGTEPGIVLDPFAGAGTTCAVAKRLGRRFVGIELNPDYVAMAQKRVGIDVDEPERLLDEGETQLAAFADGGQSDG